jgi:hypothetical protein
MVVGDFHIVGIPTLPAEHDAPLVVDPDRMPALQGPTQRLQAVPRWIAEIVEGFGFMDGYKLVV